MRRTFVISILAWTALAMGCGGKGPTSPSSNGATISGTIVPPAASASAGASGASAQSAATVPGLVVSVTGTNLAAPVDSSNHFTLRGVPAGDVQLRFSAPTFSGTLGLPAVQDTEQISIAVSLAGGAVVLESQARATGNQEQLEGRVESLPPTTAPGSLVVAGRTVTTDGDTRFYLGGATTTFAALEIGQRVHVKGTTSGSSLLASVIDIQNTNTNIPVEINGIISAFSGTAASFQFTIDGRLIKGDALTEFFGGSVFADLADGRRAEVKGLQRDGFVYATRIHVNESDGGSGESASIEGLLTSMSGGVPVLTLVVGTTTVHTGEDTEVHRRGDVQDLTVLQLGMTLHVVGVRQADSSIDARMIQIKGDAVGGLFEIEGSMGGLQGTCPALTFNVNGYDIVTDAATVFTPACGTFKSGNKVKIKGIVQANGSVKATSVEKS